MFVFTSLSCVAINKVNCLLKFNFPRWFHVSRHIFNLLLDTWAIDSNFYKFLSSQVVFSLPFHKMPFGLPIAMLACKQISSSILAFYIFDILENYVKFLVLDSSDNYFTTLRCYDKKTIVVWCSFTTKHLSWFFNCFENHLVLDITTKIWGWEFGVHYCKPKMSSCPSHLFLNSFMCILWLVHSCAFSLCQPPIQKKS